MADVVFCEQNFFDREIRVDPTQLFVQQILEKQLLSQPDRHRHSERVKTTRCYRDIGFDQAFELQKRFVVKDNIVHIGKGNS